MPFKKICPGVLKNRAQLRVNHNNGNTVATLKFGPNYYKFFDKVERCDLFIDPPRIKVKANKYGFYKISLNYRKTLGRVIFVPPPGMLSEDFKIADCTLEKGSRGRLIFKY